MERKPPAEVALIQPVLKNGKPSQPFHYYPTALISCLSKVFELILSIKIQKQLTLHNLSYHQYSVCRGYSFGNLSSLLSDSWSSSIWNFCDWQKLEHSFNFQTLLIWFHSFPLYLYLWFLFIFDFFLAALKMLL